MSCFLKGVVDKSTYRTLVADLYFVYAAMEDEIGSLRAGKSADFAVLNTDPYAVGREGLKDIAVDATVFKGTPYPING